MASAGQLKAFVLGGTGECGKEIVKELARQTNFSQVTLIGRRKIDLPASSSEEPALDYTKFQQVVVDFDRLEEHEDAFKGYDVGFCALGTTRAKSGKAGFYLVDHDYVVNAATLAKSGGCKHFNLISSTSANKNSIIYCSKVKGRTEEDVIALGFERLTIARPGLLLCDRTEQRPGEKIMGTVLGTVDKWRSTCVETTKVARALVSNCLKQPSGGAVEILDNTALNKEGA